MGSGGSIANSTITIGSSGTFDVSAAPFTLGASQTLRGSNVVNGNLTMPGTTTSAIVPGTVGTVSTLTFNNNLNMNVGGAAYFDLSTIFNGVNDQVVVAGSTCPPKREHRHNASATGAADMS